MRTIYKLAKTELQTMFYSPIAWLILVAFAFQAAMIFTKALTGMVEMLGGEPFGGITAIIFSSPWGGVLPDMQNYLYLYIPLLTMGLMSRELGSGSITLLYSSPVTNTQIILGKYLSMMIYGLALIAILLLFAVFGMMVIKDFDISAVLAGIFGLYLLICAYSAVGLFMSSLTSYQIVAAILTLSMLAFLNYVRAIGQGIELVREITFWLGISGRADEFVQGLICSEDVLYFIIVSALFLALSIIRLNACRQKSKWTVTFGKYAMVILVACLLGYISSRPKLMSYYDATSTKTNTLTSNSQDVISRMKGGLSITTYVNLLDGENLGFGLPEYVKEDQQRFKQYVRFKPEIEMKYVYYSDTTASEVWEKYYPGRTTKEIASELCRAYKLDSAMFLPAEEIRKQIDLLPEGNLFVRQLKRESGESTFLRIYNDMLRFPREQEITAAFKRLVMELPNVGFLTGHGERNNKNVGERDYNSFALDRAFRYALINQGFEVTEVNLSQPVSENINIMVIAEMKHPMNEIEEANLNQYLSRGGNLLITTEPARTEAMAALLAKFGVKQIPGTLVEITEDYAPDLILARPTQQAADLVYQFSDLLLSGETISMPSTSALEYDQSAGYTMTPLFVSNQAVWNERQTTDFTDETPVFNPETGEMQQSFVTAMTLSKTNGNKEQKIIIIGDADCISNGELAMARREIESDNYTVITGGFYWLSDKEVPIDVRRPNPTDDTIHLNDKGVSFWQVIWMWVMPALLILVATLIWLRRRGR